MDGLKRDMLSRVDKVPYLEMSVWDGESGQGECASDLAPITVRRRSNEAKSSGVEATVGTAAVREGGGS